MSTKFVKTQSDWTCPDAKCANINFARRDSCNRCGKMRPIDTVKKIGREIGKNLAEKSKGLFSADDWQCTQCGNVNWARRSTCNVCNAPKFGKVEQRTGFGGGYNERENIEYIERDDSDGEYDEFGRKKKKFRESIMQDDEDDENERENRPSKKAPPPREKIQDGERIVKAELAVEEGRGDEEDDDDEDEDLSKYDLIASEDENASAGGEEENGGGANGYSSPGQDGSQNDDTLGSSSDESDDDSSSENSSSSGESSDGDDSSSESGDGSQSEKGMEIHKESSLSPERSKRKAVSQSGDATSHLKIPKIDPNSASDQGSRDSGGDSKDEGE